MQRVRRLGERYERHRQSYSPGQRLALHEGAFELALFLPRPRAAEVLAVRSAEQEIVVAELPGVLAIATCWIGEDGDGLGWIVAPYRHGLAAPGAPFPAWLGRATDIELRTILVDADTGLVHALRAAPLPRAAVRRVAAALWRQLEEPVPAGDAEAVAGALPDSGEELAGWPGARVERLVDVGGVETFELPA